MRSALAILVLWLAACEPQNPPPAELAREMALSVNWATPEQIRVVSQANGDAAAERDGYTVLRRRGSESSCEIYVAKPIGLGTRTQTLLGHELLHCIYGAWHR